MKKIHINNDDNYATPPKLYEELNKRFNFDFDPCPYNEGEIINDGLKIEWGNSNFVNPPYSQKLKEEFVKKGVEGINLYKRQKGQTQWQLITRITRSPFDYEPELLIENQPEHYEFRAFGVIRDKEIGLSSDIVEIFYGK